MSSDAGAAASRTTLPAGAQPPFFVGVDLGGTNIKLGVVDDAGRRLSCVGIATEVGRGPADAVTRMAAAIGQAIDAGTAPRPGGRGRLGRARRSGRELGAAADAGEPARLVRIFRFATG